MAKRQAAFGREWRRAYLQLRSSDHPDVLRGLVEAQISGEVESQVSGTAAASQADAKGRTLLHQGAMFGRLKCSKLILAEGMACLNRGDESGDTPLLLCSREGHLEVVKELLKAGADPNHQNKSRHAPLHGAAFVGEIECIQALLKAEADPTLTTYTGYTPAVCARRAGEVRTAILLEEAERIWRLEHPPKPGRISKFKPCFCSFCAVLNRLGGDRSAPEVAFVGDHRPPDPNGYTRRHPPDTRHLEAESRRALDRAENQPPPRTGVAAPDLYFGPRQCT